MIYEIYIKLTNGCQLKCEHCYNEIMLNHMHMPKRILDECITWLKNFRLKHKTDTINITFHGGEPMLYKIDDINYFIDETKDLDLSYGMTTNLVYDLTDEHIKLFKRLNPYKNTVLVQTSWDYKIRFNDDEEKVWENNVTKITNEGILVQPIICLTKKLVEECTPKDIFNYITKFTNRFNFERITNTGRALNNNLRPNNDELNKWLFEAYKLYKDSNLIIPIFDGIISSLHGSFIGCRERKCMEKVITINPNGTISACPNMADKIIGDLKLIDMDKKQKLIDFERNVDIRCLMCEYYKYCNGDCCQLTWDETGCPGMKDIIKYELERSS